MRAPCRPTRRALLRAVAVVGGLALVAQLALLARLYTGVVPDEALSHVSGVYVALNLHNSEAVLPSIVASLHALLRALPGGRQAAFVSVYENGSGTSVGLAAAALAAACARAAG